MSQVHHFMQSVPQVELALRVQLDYLEVQLSKNKLDGNQANDIHTYRYVHAWT